MIIFGTRTYLYQLAILTFVCGRCGNPAAHSLRKRVMKFTLFFVPLFPLSTRYRSQCTFCGVQHDVPKDQAEALLAQAPQGAAAQGGQPGAGAQQPGGRQPGGNAQQPGPYGTRGGAPLQNPQQNPYQS